VIKSGQLRRWIPGSHGNSAFLNIGEVFLVTGFTERGEVGEKFVDYLMCGKPCWDDVDWVEKYSEVISEVG